jgi:hypothetical protein
VPTTKGARAPLHAAYYTIELPTFDLLSSPLRSWRGIRFILGRPALAWACERSILGGHLTNDEPAGHLRKIGD